jgi:cytochrome c-type biogenesis protein CcmH/NrfG
VAVGNNAEGIAVLRDFIRADPEKVSRLPAHLLIAQALAAEGKVGEASDELRAMLAVAPKMDNVRKQLADVLMVQGRFGEAAAEYRTVLTTHPAADVHRSLAEAYLRMNDAARGEQAARDALTLAPDDGRAHNLVGVALASKGNLGEAIAHFERALTINPGDTEARANLERARRAPGNAK